MYINVTAKFIKSLVNPPVNIHCWGGFASQLNGLSLAHRISDKFINKKVVLIIHEGGRHNAKYELEDLDLSSFNIKLVTDSNITEYRLKNNSWIKYHKILKFFLFKIGVYSNCDSILAIQSLKPWIATIRGSYNVVPTDNFLKFLHSQIVSTDKEKVYNVVIHYRLGDLINLKEKDPISTPTLIELLESIETKQLVNNIIVLTSDPEIAIGLFEKSNPRIAKKTFFRYARPSEVLSFGMLGEFFIGTNSKISLWAIWLRTMNNSTNNYLPKDFDSLYKDQFQNQKPTYY